MASTVHWQLETLETSQEDLRKIFVLGILRKECTFSKHLMENLRKIFRKAVTLALKQTCEVEVKQCRELICVMWSV